MRIELTDEQVDEIVRLKNHLSVQGIGRAVHGRGLVRVADILAFKPEAERIGSLLKMLGGWRLSGDLLVEDDGALALLVPTDAQLTFEQTFPHDRFRSLILAAELLAGQKATFIAAKLNRECHGIQPIESEAFVFVESPALAVDETAAVSEPANLVSIRESQASKNHKTADESFLSAENPPHAATLKAPVLRELLEKAQVEQQVIEAALVTLSAKKSMICVVVDRGEGISGPLALPPTETLRTPVLCEEHKPREMVGVVVMIDAAKRMARLQTIAS